MDGLNRLMIDGLMNRLIDYIEEYYFIVGDISSNNLLCLSSD